MNNIKYPEYLIDKLDILNNNISQYIIQYKKNDKDIKKIKEEIISLENNIAKNKEKLKKLEEEKEENYNSIIHYFKQNVEVLVKNEIITPLPEIISDDDDYDDDE